MTGFEPATSSSRTTRATKLRHTPLALILGAFRKDLNLLPSLTTRATKLRHTPLALILGAFRKDLNLLPSLTTRATKLRHTPKRLILGAIRKDLNLLPSLTTRATKLRHTPLALILGAFRKDLNLLPSLTTRATKLRHTPLALILLTLGEVAYMNGGMTLGNTHDWSVAADADHVLTIQKNSELFAKGGITHLVLEVIAYAVDEAIMGTTDQIHVTLYKDGSVCVEDNGRGTAVREVSGTPVVKPIMATQDLRFFGITDAPVLPDGLVRSGISVVAALSEWAVHTNRRANGSWTQRYEHGLPSGSLTSISENGRTGTSIYFRPNQAIFGNDVVSPSNLRQMCTRFDPAADILISEEQ